MNEAQLYSQSEKFCVQQQQQKVNGVFILKTAKRH